PGPATEESPCVASSSIPPVSSVAWWPGCHRRRLAVQPFAANAARGELDLLQGRRPRYVDPRERVKGCRVPLEGAIMDFAHAAHRETHRRVEEYLGELFEDPYHDRETGHFYVRYGTTVLEISVDPYGPEETMVQVMAYCVQGVRLEPDLLLGLLEL